MRAKVLKLSEPQVLVAALPDGQIEITINGRADGQRHIIQFELLPAQAHGTARDIAHVLVMSQNRERNTH